MVGESKRSIFVDLKLSNVFDIVVAVAESIGKDVESNKTLKSLKFKTKYGLQRVPVRIDLRPNDSGTDINITASSDDIWGGGARKCIDKFVDELEKHLNN
ncbi:hypothetical protein JXA48_01705 [Candidatus Woesearchaeota archaeon]|nr:hypothetical protein [Candidatus Woesearchaeota archaeon]